jgi:hypothetical protein
MSSCLKRKKSYSTSPERQQMNEFGRK